MKGFFGGVAEEVGIVNKGKRKKKKGKSRKRRSASKPKAKTRWRTKAVTKYKYRKRAAKRSPRRRKHAGMVAYNPIGRDIFTDIKNGAMVAAGAIVAVVVAAYAREKIELVAENEYAPAAIMVGTGIVIPMFLKGKNRKLATLLGFGAISTGIGLLVSPLLAGKVPGFEGELEGYVPTRALPGLAGFIPETVPGSQRLGALSRGNSRVMGTRGVDPFAREINAFAFGGNSY